MGAVIVEAAQKFTIALVFQWFAAVPAVVKAFYHIILRKDGIGPIRSGNARIWGSSRDGRLDDKIPIRGENKGWWA